MAWGALSLAKSYSTSPAGHLTIFPHSSLPPLQFYDLSLKKKKKKKKGMPDFMDEDDEGAAVEQTGACRGTEMRMDRHHHLRPRFVCPEFSGARVSRQSPCSSEQLSCARA